MQMPNAPAPMTTASASGGGPAECGCIVCSSALRAASARGRLDRHRRAFGCNMAVAGGETPVFNGEPFPPAARHRLWLAQPVLAPPAPERVLAFRLWQIDPRAPGRGLEDRHHRFQDVSHLWSAAFMLATFVERAY